MRAVQHFNFLDWIVPALLWKLKILVRAQLQLFKLFKATFSRVEKVHWNFCVLKMLKTFPHPSLGSVVQSYAVIGPFLSWFLFEWLHFSLSVAHCTGIQEVVQARNHSMLLSGWNKAVCRSKLLCEKVLRVKINVLCCWPLLDSNSALVHWIEFDFKQIGNRNSFVILSEIFLGKFTDGADLVRTQSGNCSTQFLVALVYS